jgi:hypothetical protein
VTTWQYAVGHRWQYDEEPSRMEFRFRESNEAKEAGFCGCACGLCKPEHPHLVEEGCICALFGCHCLYEEESAG